ncbi:MAG: hypothetical protein JWM40_675 [Frankiales bacterium]|nr:hypothetical protein [Frankiales bacterium]
MTPRNRWARLERRLAEAPFETPIAIWFGCIGWIGLISGRGITPASLQDTLPIWLVQAWTVGIALGGTLTALGKLRQRDRLESSGLVLLGYGVTLYGATLAVAAGLNGATAAAAMFAIAAGCAIRLRVLTLSHRARSVAGVIAHHTEDCS